MLEAGWLSVRTCALAFGCARFSVYGHPDDSVYRHAHRQTPSAWARSSVWAHACRQALAGACTRSHACKFTRAA
eukprot:3840867-Pleurochrysis_carterae.AAC.3